MKKFMIFHFFILIFFNIGHGQNLQTNDSLKVLLRNISSDSIDAKARIYGEIIWNFATTRTKLDTARLYTDSLLAFSQDTDFDSGIAKSSFYYGVINRFEGNYKDGLQNLEKSLNYFQLQRDSAEIAANLYQIAVIKQNLGDFAESLEAYYTVLRIYKKKKDENNVATVLQSIGHILRKVGKHEQAITNYEEAVKILEKADDRAIGLSISFESLGNTYAEIGEFEKSESYYLKSLAIEENANNIDGIASVTENLGNLYYEKGDFPKALSYQLEALKTRENMPSKTNIAICLNKVGKTYIKLGQNQLARKHLLKSLDISSQINSKPLLKVNYGSLVTLSEISKDFRKGFEYQKLLLAINDSIFNKDKTKQILELETKYETEKKEREIAEQKLIIEQKERQKNQTLLGVGMLAILLIGMFIFFRKRIKYQRTIAVQAQSLQNQKITELQQRNKLLALNSMIEGQEAERLRIAKDLHDSLGGLLSTVKNHFATIQKEIEQIEKLDLTKKTNTLIDEACMEVRRISHNMMPHALSISGLQGAIEDLGEQLNEAGYNTTVEFAGVLTTLDDTKKVMIYRLVQEIISNIRKHATAKTILIQLLDHQNELKLIIEDDGKGFSYDKAIAKGGLGLKSVNSRVEFLDGEIYWDSEIDKGTTVSITIPL